MNSKNLKYLVGVLLILILAVTLVWTKSREIEETQNKNHTFVDQVGGWQIEYPPEIDSISLNDEPGPRNSWISNVTFRDQTEYKQWYFSVGVSPTNYQSLDEYLRALALDGQNIEILRRAKIDEVDILILSEFGSYSDKNMVAIKDGRMFFITAHHSAEIEEIISWFSFI